MGYAFLFWGVLAMPSLLAQPFAVGGAVLLDHGWRRTAHVLFGLAAISAIAAPTLLSRLGHAALVHLPLGHGLQRVVTFSVTAFH